jgi:hypothetical protein
VTDRRPPLAYRSPGTGVRGHKHFYLEPQPDHDGPTPLFMVMQLDSGGRRPIAERCLLDDGISIVEALRLDYSITTWGTG